MCRPSATSMGSNRPTSAGADFGRNFARGSHGGAACGPRLYSTVEGNAARLYIPCLHTFCVVCAVQCVVFSACRRVRERCMLRVACRQACGFGTLWYAPCALVGTGVAPLRSPHRGRMHCSALRGGLMQARWPDRADRRAHRHRTHTSGRAIDGACRMARANRAADRTRACRATL